MKKTISIIGGDLRIVNLVKILAEDEYRVYVYGLEKTQELQGLEEVICCDTLSEATQKSDVILSSIPLSYDGVTVNAPLSEQKILLDEMSQNLKGKKFIAGKLTDKIQNDESIESYDILNIEQYAILNAIATAEGAIQIAMEETSKTLFDSNILVMGFGRIGKILSKMLKGIGANVYCEARKSEDLAYIKAYGYTPVHLKDLEENLHKFDIIINNIPVQILDKSKLDLVKKDVLIIDLASKPGGIDFEYAQKKDIKTIWALGLPGKVAPVSAAEYIKDTIYEII